MAVGDGVAVAVAVGVLICVAVRVGVFVGSRTLARLLRVGMTRVGSAEPR